MSSSDCKVLSGYEFVQEVIGRNRFRSGDNLVNAGGGECQWLEFKAVVRIAIGDREVQRLVNEGMSEGDACNSETRRNLERIAKTIVSLYNTRGGCVLIGVCEQNGIAVPTVYLESADCESKLVKRGLFGILRYLLAFFKGVFTTIKDLKALGGLNSLFKLRRDNDGQATDVQLEHLFERKIIFYKGIPIIALVVKWTANRNGVVLGSEDLSQSCRLWYRKGANNEVCNWPLVVNQRNDFDETRLDAETNDDLYQKIVSLAYLKRPNLVMRILEKVIGLFDRSFVVRAVSYILSPAARGKLYARLRISFLYYGFYFIFLNALLFWFAGTRFILLIAMFIGLAMAVHEMKMRVEGLKLSIWAFVPTGIFILLGSVAPSRHLSICASSVGLVTSLIILSIMLKSPRLSTDNESALSQITTLFVYLFVVIVQFPFVLLAISESGRSMAGNYILAFVVNLIPVVSSIVAARIAIVYYDGFFVGCILMFYSPYILLFASAVFSYTSEIVIVPKRFRDCFAWLCEKVIILSVFGLFYMILSSVGAIREAADKKKWDKEIREAPTRVANSDGKKLEPQEAEKASPKERLTINDCFAQAFASYYYCYSNEVSHIMARSNEIDSEDCNRRYKIAINRHYNGLKNIEYSFIGSSNVEDFEDEDFDEEDYFGDFLSDRKLDVDGRITELFLEYIEAIRQVDDPSGGGDNDVRNSFSNKANEIRQRLFDRFKEMELKINWRFIEWINRPRQ